MGAAERNPSTGTRHEKQWAAPIGLLVRRKDVDGRPSPAMTCEGLCRHSRVWLGIHDLVGEFHRILDPELARQATFRKKPVKMAHFAAGAGFGFAVVVGDEAGGR